MGINGQLVTLDTLLLAGISDKLGTLVWFQTEDGEKGQNRPVPLVNMLTNNQAEKKDDVIIFDSGEDFSEQRLRLIKGGG